MLPQSDGNGNRDPASYLLQSYRGNGLFDIPVLADGTGFGRLEQMIQTGHFNDLKALVTTLLQRLSDRRKIPVGQNLHILLTDHRQNRARYVAQGRRGVVREKLAVPWRRELWHDGVCLRAKDWPQLFFECSIVVPLHDHVLDTPLRFALFDCGGVGDAFRFGGSDDLFDNYLVPPNTGPGHQHDESYVPMACGHHWRNDATSAVADEAYTLRVDFAPGLQVCNGRLRIVREIGVGRLNEDPARFADASIVGTQHREAFAGQVVRQHQERLVAQHALVAILLARTGDQYDYGGKGRGRLA